MSSDTSPPAESNASSTKPARNPIERIVVWLLIIGLVAVCGREAVARFGYTNSLNKLQAALDADDTGDTLTVDEIPGHLSGSPSREEDQENRIISYHWSGLLKDYGSIHLQYSDENEVLGLLTADAPPVPEPTYAESDDVDDMHGADPTGAAQMSGESGGGGEGRRGFDPTEFDSDGDGKLSLEEAPQRMQERFAEIDTNGDGFVDQEEFAARRAARDSNGGDRPQRPQRPDETGEAESPAEPPADSKSDTSDAADASEDTNGEQPAAEKPAEPSADE